MSYGRLYYLPARVEKQTMKSMSPVNLVNAVTTPSERMLYEYCCAEDSLIASWVEAHRQGALRLTLPDYDMAQWANAGCLVAMLTERASQELKSFVWAALTCTP